MTEEKKRGKAHKQRVPREKSVESGLSKTQPGLSEKQNESTDALDEWSNQSEIDINELEITLPHQTHPGPFSTLLSSLLHNDRTEVLRVAKAVGVSDITVYRWLNGVSAPRSAHMQRLADVLSPNVQVAGSTSSTQSGYQHAQPGPVPGRWDVPRDLYRRVLEQAATTADDSSRRWHIIETIFEQALLFFDPDHDGLALTYVRLMPPCADGTIHSLFEAEMRGQAPWPFALDFKTYLGSTTLAGVSAMSLRVRMWSKADPETRTQVGVDAYERSSCAAPVMRGARLAGVLMASSVRDDFAVNPAVPRAMSEYANLLAAGLMDQDFYPTSIVKLVPMPDLTWQRERISHLYLPRVIECARKQGLSFPEAEQRILQDLEEEFERHAAGRSDSAEPGIYTEIEQPH